MASVINKHGSMGSDARAYEKLFSGVSAMLQKNNGQTFGESLMNLQNNDKKNILNAVANFTFSSDLNKTIGESASSTNAGLKASFRKSFIEDLKNEFLARGESIVSGLGESALGALPSQQWAVYGSNIMTPSTQLNLMALAPAVIKPIHNKLVKSVVTKDIEYHREALAPYIYTEDGQTINFYEYVNSKDEYKKYTTGGQKTLSVTVPLENKTIKEPTLNGNICDIYNREEQLKNPKSFKAINSIHDFVGRGVRIVAVKLKDVDEPLAVDYLSTGAPVQSGQLSDIVATIQLKLDTKDGKAESLELLGNIRANGKIILAASSDKIEAVTFEFFIPAKGAINALKVVDLTTTFREPITRHSAAATTLNQQLLDDHRLRLNKDIVTLFSERSVELVNAKKDGDLLNYIEDRIQIGVNKKSIIAEKYVNSEIWEGFKDSFAHTLVDMTSSEYGYTDVLHGHNIALSMGMFKVCNAIDVAMNPQERNFTIYSSSLAAQWIRDAQGKDINSLHVSGEVNELGETVGGITTPYQIQNIKIGGLYSAQYVVTNKVVSQEVPKKVINKAGETVNAFAKRHRYTLIPRFEENMDSILFLHGLEYVSEGVNDSEYFKDKTLQYETRYDITTFNKALGAVDMIENPSEAFKK